MDPRLRSRINAKKDRLDRLRPIPRSILQRLREQLDLEWIYNSNAIEGSTLTLQETRLILETGVTIGGKTLREHFEVLNHRDAIEFLESIIAERAEITPHLVRQVHQLVLKQIDDEFAGRYRETQVRIAGATHIPPDSWEVPRMMTEWGDWLRSESGELHPVEFAAAAHHRLVAIHPFVDGNGRTARLVMNLILMKVGYPPTVIERRYRAGYYRVLSRADEGNSAPLSNFVGRAVERSLDLYLDAALPVAAAPDPDETWIPLHDAARGSPYSQEYLSLLARKGRLEAKKKGRIWVTTKKALQDYIRSIEANTENS